jgi:inositol 1,4,5-triphosphate receptor type 1
LSSLCVSSGRSIPSTQKRLLDELVVKYGRKLLLTTKLEKVSGTQENYVVVYYKPGIEGRISIRDIKSHEADYKLMKAQLDLFIKLCKGNNRKVIEYLKGSNGFVTFTEALACVNDEEVDIKIRSRYVDLILVMFVDVDNNTPFMDHLCYSFVSQ